MDRLYELLLEIKKNPSLYLGEPSIDRLRLFIAGYSVCCSQFEIDVENRFVIDFPTFIRHKYNVSLSLHHTQIIKENSSSDEDAFFFYFKLLVQYINETNTIKQE